MHKWQRLFLACEKALIISAAVARAFLCVQESMRPQQRERSARGLALIIIRARPPQTSPRLVANLPA